MTWQQNAACAEYEDPDAFVPESRTEREQMRETVTARTICAMCSVSDECLTDAIRERDFHTVRGGTVPIARTPGRKQQRPHLPRQGDEALWLFEGGLSPEHIAQAMNVQVASIERSIMRLNKKVPWPQQHIERMKQRTVVQAS
jgi:hypothetical protein